MADESLDVLQGTLDLLILRTLSWQPMHGFGVSRWIRDRTGDRLEIRDGALYPALRRLEDRDWVEAEWGRTENNRRARYYRLTPRGEEQLVRERTAWERYAEAVSQVLAPVDAGAAAGGA